MTIVFSLWNRKSGNKIEKAEGRMGYSRTFIRVRKSAARMIWTIGFCVACLAAPDAGAAPQGPWVLPATDVSNPGGSAFDPQVAIGPDGTTTALWRRWNGSNYIVQTSSRPPGGGFAAVEDLSADGHSAENAQIAIGPDGTTTALWLRDVGSDDILQVRTRPPGGSFAPAENLSASGLDSRQPDISIGSDGTTAVIWNRDNVTNDRIRGRIRPPGGSFGAIENWSVAGQDLRNPKIAVGPDGSTSAAWLQSDSTHFIVQTRNRTATGNFGLIQPLSSAGQNAQNPGIAVGPDGTVVVIWRWYNGSDFIVQSRTRPAAGPFGTTANLSAPVEDGIDPQIAVGDDGTTVATWFRSSGLNVIVQARVRPPGETVFTGLTENVTGAVEVGDDLDVAVAPDGTSTAIWYAREGPTIFIQSATRPPGGSFDAPGNLSSAGQDSSYPQIAIAPDGVATAIWSRYDGTHDIIQAASTTRPKYPLIVQNANPNRGSVTSTPTGIDCGALCQTSLIDGAHITLAAHPKPGSKFNGWSGACAGESLNCDLTMAGGAIVFASFTAGDTRTCPKKKLKPGKLKRNRRRGSARLEVTAGGRGKVVLKSSKKVKRSVSKVGKNGKGKLVIKPRGNVAGKLRRRGKVRLKLKLVYRPRDGCTNKRKSKRVRLIRK